MSQLKILTQRSHSAFAVGSVSDSSRASRRLFRFRIISARWSGEARRKALARAIARLRLNCGGFTRASDEGFMRAHRLAVAARNFAEVTLLGPTEPTGAWPALPTEPWIKTVEEKRFPKFFSSFVQLVEAAESVKALIPTDVGPQRPDRGERPEQ